MANYDSIAIAIEIQKEREIAKQMVEDLTALATALKNRAASQRESMETAQGNDYDYLEGLVDAYEICYNMITDILNKGDK